MLRPKRILVTGGAGFLDSFPCEPLFAEGYEVICVDLTIAYFDRLLATGGRAYLAAE